MNAEGTRAGVFTGAVSAKQLLIGVLGSATGKVVQPLARSVSTGQGEARVRCFHSLQVLGSMMLHVTALTDMSTC